MDVFEAGRTVLAVRAYQDPRSVIRRRLAGRGRNSANRSPRSPPASGLGSPLHDATSILPWRRLIYVSPQVRKTLNLCIAPTVGRRDLCPPQSTPSR